MIVYVDQDFGSMEGIINPEHYYHMQSQHPTSGQPPVSFTHGHTHRSDNELFE